jgi:hypothetical protein
MTVHTTTTETSLEANDQIECDDGVVGSVVKTVHGYDEIAERETDLVVIDWPDFGRKVLTALEAEYLLEDE